MPQADDERTNEATMVRSAARAILGIFLTGAGIGHWVIPREFLGQVPPFLPGRLAVVYVSGVVEIGLGLGLLLVGSRHRPRLGWVVAAFFLAILPGNLAQAIYGTDSFGLDTPASRWLRLLFQPVLIAWALWSTGAYPRPRRRPASQDRDPDDG